MSAMFSFEGRVALVTGAGQGVGECIADVLARAGALVAVNDIVGERAEAVAQRLREAGGRAMAVAADVTDQAQIQQAVETARSELGPVDILVSNAGIPATGMKLAEFADSSPVEWSRHGKRH